MNPGQPITLHQIADAMATAYTRSCSAENIISGLKGAEIWPLGQHVFTCLGFIFSSVTNKPLPMPLNPQPPSLTLPADTETSSHAASTNHQINNSECISAVITTPNPQTGPSKTFSITPTQVKPLHKKHVTTPKKKYNHKKNDSWLCE